MTTSSVKNTHKPLLTYAHTTTHTHTHPNTYTCTHTHTQMLRPQITGERELSLEEFDKVDGGDRFRLQFEDGVLRHLDESHHHGLGLEWQTVVNRLV